MSWIGLNASCCLLPPENGVFFLVGRFTSAVQASNSLPEALWQEQQWFAEHTPSGMQGMQNVGVHHLLWRVQDWLIPQINNNLAALKEDIRARCVMSLSALFDLPVHALDTCHLQRSGGSAEH